MDTTEIRRRSGTKIVAISAMALGIAAGSYGVAAAATGSSTATTASSSSMASSLAQNAAATDPKQPWGGQRSDETVLTGDTADKVEAAAVAKLSGATVVRVETDADDNAAYEVHMVTADGTPTTVYVDKQFAVVSVETR